MTDFDQENQHVKKQVNINYGTGAGQAAASSPHAIPAPVKDFVGRGDDLAHLEKQLADGGAGICGVRGMGGVGKTELAKKLAKRVGEKYPGPQLMIELQGTPAAGQTPLTPAQALQRLIFALDPNAKPPDDEDGLAGEYQRLLHGRRALVLLDNARDAAQIARLVPPDGCGLIVTSRENFHLPGLQLRNLDVLPAEDARQLLHTIAPRIGDAAPAIAKLCGYLPFALRLAGGALAEHEDLSPDEYLARLGDLKEKLKLIEASITLSYDLLDEEQQVRWRALGVFSGAFHRLAAGAIWNMPAEPAHDAISELVRRSMVEWDEKAKRYRLHDLARVFARSRLDDGELAAAQERHAAHFVRVLVATNELYLEKGKDLEGLGLFDAERHNIEAGQRWAAENMAASEDAAHLCNSYPGVGVYCLNLRLHPRDWIGWLESALAAARKLEDRSAEGRHLCHLGIAYIMLDDARRAIEYLEQALEISREIGNRSDEGAALGNLGLAHAELGEARCAIEFYEQVLEIMRTLGDRLGEGTVLGNLGNAYADLDGERRAIEFYEQALEIAREIGDRRGEGNHLGNLGTSYFVLGDSRRAIELYEQNLKIMREIGYRHGESTTLRNLGLAHAELGDARRAIEYHEKALAISREIGERSAEANVSGNLGDAYVDLGDARRAIEFYEQQLEITHEIGDRSGEGAALGNLGLAYAALGDARRAVEFYEQQLEITREIGDRHGEGAASFSKGLALDMLGRREEAIACAEAALAIYEEIEDPHAPRVREAIAAWKSGAAGDGEDHPEAAD